MKNGVLHMRRRRTRRRRRRYNGHVRLATNACNGCAGMLLDSSCNAYSALPQTRQHIISYHFPNL
ncbi:hypothetical protein BDZ91DRAFT_712189, partial [Kalaharituber pfeilii]